MRRIGPSVSSLSNLKIGSLTLSPTFDPAITSYTVSTSNASNKVTATAADSNDTITILNGSTTVTNGTAASWSSGENILTITVADADTASNSTTYTVTVTCTAS